MSVLRFLVTVVCCCVPWSSMAANPPAYIWPSVFRSITEMPGGTDRLHRLVGQASEPNGWAGEIRELELPFSFRFFDGRTYTAVNIGAKGYITFGAWSSDTRASVQYPDRLLLADFPEHAVAAWWGDHICFDTGSILTKTLGMAPHRIFIVEWNRCSRAMHHAGGIYGSSASFQAQIWLEEGKDVVRIRYGDIKEDLNEPSFRSGYAWGLKTSSIGGFIGPTEEEALNDCYPTTNYGGPRRDCLHEDFPTFSTIQYGAVEGAELVAKIMDVEGVSSQEGTLRLSASWKWMNVGDRSGDQAELVLYVQQRREIQPGAQGSHELYRQTMEEVIPAGGSVSHSTSIVAPAPSNGLYFLCALVDPERSGVDPIPRSSCFPDVVTIGPDLTGSIEAPSEGYAGGSVVIPVRASNIGTADGESFAYRLRMIPIGGDAREPTEVIYVGSHHGLAVGAESEWEVEVLLPSPLRGGQYELELELNHDGMLDEADRENNRSTSTGAMVNLRPRLALSRPVDPLEFPGACFYEEEVSASFEICNEGEVPASGFQPGLLVGEEQLSFLADVTIAASPPPCAAAEDCAPVGGMQPHCLSGSCRLECGDDSDCGAELRCRPDPLLGTELARSGVWSCMNFLGAAGEPRSERCRSYQLRGTVPLELEERDAVVVGAHRFHVVDDILLSLNQSHVDVMSFGPLQCLEALPDLIPAEIAPLTAFIAGKAADVRRSFENIGFQGPGGERFRYAYYLIPADLPDADWIPLELLEGEASAAIGGDGWGARTDRLALSSDLRPGQFQLGLVVDPFGELRELSRSNNRLLHPDPIRIEAAGLRVATEQLPRAVQNVHYSQSLVGVGGLGLYEWSALALPPGMELSRLGLLSGVPAQPGSFAFRVRLRSGDATVERLLALQVIEATSPLEVATTALPLAIRGRAYGLSLEVVDEEAPAFPLVARGGHGPMRWELDPDVPGNRLPQGLEGPSSDGKIQGVPGFGALSRVFVVRVTDVLGNRASRSLEIQVVDEQTLALRHLELPVGTSGEPYRGCLEAVGGIGGLAWELETSLPQGLVGEEQGAQLCLVGIPTSCGAFELLLRVEDQAAQHLRARTQLIVDCGTIQLDTRRLQPMRRGETVAFQLGAVPSAEPSFRIAWGELPAGLSLLSSGRIEGTVSEEARIGSYDLGVEIQDLEGRRSLRAASLRIEGEAPVVAPGPRSPTSGCGSAGGGFDLLGVWIVLLGLVGWRVSRPLFRSGAVKCGSLGLLAAAALSGCAGEVEGGPALRCAEVLCDGALECDEADGLCKCGGALGRFCGEAEICVGDTFPQCISPLCDFVACERGMSCNARLGECLCGETRCEEDERCSGGSCTKSSHCEASGCDRGMSCDLLDGVCKCGEASCDEPQVCVLGQCVIDPCAGVSCAANSSCNPQDGTCHCGSLSGAICNTGEACLETDEAFSCGISTLCDGKSCGGGTVCDPDDGSCRCGGVGNAHPSCTPEEVCVDGRCRGGLLCEPEGVPTVCERGSSCDPADGRCRCGGAGGEECLADEVCVHLEDGSSCQRPCSYLEIPSACQPPQACYAMVEGAEVVEFCFQEGQAQLGDRCVDASDCRGGMSCSQEERCVPSCDLGDGADYCSRIGAALVCIPFIDGGTLGRCQ